MVGRIHEFDAREGGSYRISLTYLDADHAAPGKTAEHTDVARVRFVELVPDRRMVQRVEFETDNPAFAAPMTITWTLTDVPGGTEVAIVCEDAPEGIRPEDHEAGFRSSLENLAAFIE